MREYEGEVICKKRKKKVENTEKEAFHEGWRGKRKKEEGKKGSNFTG